MSNAGGTTDQGARFRAVASERLERIEASWGRLREGEDSRVCEDLERDLKYVQSHARIAGFSDVSLVARRIEDIVAAAKSVRFKVSDEIDTTMTLAIQFLQMLARRRSDASSHSADVVGFLKQVDDSLREQRTGGLEAQRPRQTTGRRAAVIVTHLTGSPSVTIAAVPAPPAPLVRVEGSSTARLATATLAVYLEHLRASGPARFRLREAWSVLSRDLWKREPANDSTPARDRELEVNVFASTSGAFQFAVPIDWTVTVDPLARRGALNASTLFELPEATEAKSSVALRLRKGAREVCLLAGGVPVKRLATRIAPALADEPLEIVQVDGKDVLLLRMEWMRLEVSGEQGGGSAPGATGRQTGRL